MKLPFVIISRRDYEARESTLRVTLQILKEYSAMLNNCRTALREAQKQLPKRDEKGRFKK